jgi:hypothetical protein
MSGQRSVALGSVVAGAVLLRLWLLTTPALTLEADEAVTGIMARRILDGHHRAYYAGQGYMGTLEQYLQAGVLAILPDGDLVLRLPQVVLAGVACALAHQLGRRCGLSSRRAVFAAAVFAGGPYFLTYWGAKSRGGYAAAMVLSLLGLLIALGPRDEERRDRRAVAFGLVAGAAFWTNQQAAIVLLPAAWWLWASLRPRPARSAALLGAGFVVGAFPALWHTATTGTTPFATGGGNSRVPDRLHHLVTATVPDLLGLRDDGERLVPFLAPTLVGVVALAGLVALAVRRRRGWARSWCCGLGSGRRSTSSSPCCAPLRWCCWRRVRAPRRPPASCSCCTRSSPCWRRACPCLHSSGAGRCSPSFPCCSSSPTPWSGPAG